MYATADGGHVAVGPIEPAFFAELLDRLGVTDLDPSGRYAPEAWPVLRQRLADVFGTRTRDEWADHFADSDACVTPVLSMGEAPAHPHNAARSTFVSRDGVVQPAPAPRFSRTTADPGLPAPVIGEHTDAVLADLGLAKEEIAGLRERGVIH